MPRKRSIYLKQKLRLYFDVNFPKNVVEALKTEQRWGRKCKIYSANDLGFENKDDKFLLEYCRKRNFVLVTLDKDFMDDRQFPFSKIPGIIRVIAKKNDHVTILSNLMSLLTFLSFFPFPRGFMSDTKIEARSNGCLIRGRDATTREIKTMFIGVGDQVKKVRNGFGF
jgi:predicted nuclease of predicted toxin-antitoxin system